jgi:hypothetical protein
MCVCASIVMMMVMLHAVDECKTSELSPGMTTAIFCRSAEICLVHKGRGGGMGSNKTDSCTAACSLVLQVCTKVVLCGSVYCNDLTRQSGTLCSLL